MSNIGIKYLLHMIIIIFNFVKILKLWLKENLKLKYTLGKINLGKKNNYLETESENFVIKVESRKRINVLREKNYPLLQNK